MIPQNYDPQFSINLSGQKLQQFPKSREIKNMISINLTDNQISQIPKQLKQCQSLILAKNNISIILPDFVQNIQNYSSLKVLDLSYNFIQTIPILLIKTHLLSLFLFHNSIKGINLTNSTIQHVDLGMNQITKFPKLSPFIISLSLDHNKIEILDYVNPKMGLNILSLSRNNISSIHPDFTCIPLVTLDLSYNNITKLPSLKKTLPHLRRLDISYNKITSLPLLPKSLIFINCRHNLITVLPDTLSTNTHIIIADFSLNKIEDIKWEMNFGLEQLFLFSNSLKHLPLIKVQSLRQLYLMNNQLEEFPHFDFTIIPPLVSISLHQYRFRHNNISCINEQDISKETKEVDLAYNNLNQTPEFLFHLPAIEHVYLNHNFLTTLSSNSFHDSPLIILNLSHNKISLPDEFPPFLEELYLDYCNLLYLPSSLSNLTELMVLDVSRNQLTELPDLPYIQKLNASMNHLSTLPKLPDEMISLDLSFNDFVEFQAFPKLKILDISYNQFKPDLMINEFKISHPEIDTLILETDVNSKICCAQFIGFRETDFDFYHILERDNSFAFAEYNSFVSSKYLHENTVQNLLFPSDLCSFSYTGGTIKVNNQQLEYAVKNAVFFSIQQDQEIHFISGKRYNDFSYGIHEIPQMSLPQKESIVFEEGLSADYSNVFISSQTHFVVLCSQCVVEILSDDELKTIIQENPSSTLLAHSIKNAVISSGSTDNFTILVYNNF